jgi:WhiB family redox-sensing transcriptional regulator
VSVGTDDVLGGWLIGQPWRAGAACIGAPVAMFFPERGDDNGDAAKAVCATCAVRVECLQWALDQPELQYGVWGGLSVRQRARARVLGLSAQDAVAGGTERLGRGCLRRTARSAAGVEGGSGLATPGAAPNGAQNVTGRL